MAISHWQALSGILGSSKKNRKQAEELSHEDNVDEGGSPKFILTWSWPDQIGPGLSALATRMIAARS